MSYAQAMFELASEQGCEKEVYDAVLVLHKCLLSHPRYIAVISSPVIEDKEKLLRELLQNAPMPLRNTLLLLCEKNQGFSLIEVLENYIAHYRRENGILEVTALSAVPLSAEIQERLHKALQKKFDSEILLETNVDPSCIGGLKLQMNGRQYDGSIARQLDEIGNLLFDNTQIMYEINSAKAGDRS